MRRERYFIFIVCLVLFNCISTNSVKAAFSEYYFKQINIEDGLSSSRVQSTAFDHKGYMWIGTQWGLNCYDRDVIIQYFYEPDNEQSLPSNDILFVVEDDERNLWIGTRNGLALFNRYESNFTRIVVGGKNLNITSYLLTDDGILFGGIGFLYKYEYGSKEIVTVPIKRDQILYNSYIDLVRYDEDIILVNTRWFGVYSYNLKTHEFVEVPYVSKGNISALYVDSLQQVWVSYYGKGITCFYKGKQIRQFDSKNSPISYDVILDIEEKDGYLWLATDGGGINILSIRDFEFEKGLYNGDEFSSFPTNGVFSLYRDSSNNMWAGSIRNGLIGIRKVFAKSFNDVPFKNQYGLSNRTINCFYQEDENTIWIGTDGGGINSYHPSEGVFRHYSSLKQEKVTSITRYNDDELLVFLFNKGLVLFNKKTDSYRSFSIVNEDINEQTCIDGYSVFTAYLKSNKVFISADHIYLYDLDTKEFEIIASKGKEYVRNSPQVRKMDEQNVCFIDNYKIYNYNTQTKLFSTEYEGDKMIVDMCIDRDNNYWIGTHEGLYFYDTQTGYTEEIKTDLFRGVKSLIADHDGNIWIGASTNILFSYSIETKQFALFGESHGVMPNEYLFGSTLVSSDGTVYLGGTMGMTILNRDLPIYNNTTSSIFLVDVIVNGTPLKREISNEVTTIEVPWTFSSVRLKMLVKEDDIFRNHIFKYLIKGRNQEEEMKSLKHTFTINNLPHGNYDIMVSYITPSGEWSEPSTVLSMLVTPPWWKSVWFVSICFVLFIYLLYIGINRYNRGKELRQQEEIERLKDEVYEEKIRFLTNISHELRTPLTLIYSPLKRILDDNCEVEHLPEKLTNIYKQSLQMKEVIDLVLDIKKLEDGKEVLEVTLSSFNDWVDEALSQFDEEFHNKRIHVVVNYDNRIGRIAFDHHKCLFVLHNLLMNALKFSESDTQIEITTELTAENRVRLEVKDQGIGLGNVDIPQLFTRYYQGDHDKAGSGIGLSYAKSLIDLHKGEIGALNNPDKGATFYFELPLTTDIINPQSPLIPAKSPIEKLDLSLFENYSVLVVEDIGELRKYLSDTLSPYFKKVYRAKDGVEGLIQVRQQLPDVIISDVMMPRMDGFEFCKTIKEDSKISHIPVILLTAYTDTSNVSTGYKLGADVILSKPFDVEVLLSLIANQLTLRESIKTQYQDQVGLPVTEEPLNNADEAFLGRFHAIIDQEIANSKLDVTLITKHLGISRSLLYNKIKEFTDMGIVDYINHRRITKAIDLLENTSYNITEISEKVGFSSPRYFSRVFKNQEGVSPSQFRKQL